MVACHHSSQETNMIYINKKRTIGSTGDLIFFNAGPEWTISGVNAYKTDSNQPGSSISEGNFMMRLEGAPNQKRVTDNDLS